MVDALHMQVRRWLPLAEGSPAVTCEAAGEVVATTETMSSSVAPAAQPWPFVEVSVASRRPPIRKSVRGSRLLAVTAVTLATGLLLLSSL